ncbi:chromosome segregation protein SudA [Viridothelium virens]|uniref:Chromosome segregation protein SudA n=1 Tax=Viridothelium virens TaxID=1048519 RepID=A0A6A6GX04_VIRVR|nr:chromosome segregation protein SudA [Viridothelium virens]
MHIKQIIIQGFKSYKDQTVIEPFSPKHNVIVGRNGSGKSNFFAAIRFVLSDAYTQMGREERQALLHEGSGSAVMTAYVEVIFDNLDERFPTGVKKDEYSLNRKNATKADVMNLLESAGFSRSNPYYIVPQGRVTTLTNMKDQERLNLLKEVAGTQVYEARRTESLRIMEDSEHKREKTDESMDVISNRLAELEEEKEELRQYQDKDRERRCLEYSIHHQTQVRTTRELDQIEALRQNGAEDTEENSQRFIEGEQEMDALEKSIGEEKNELGFLKIDRQQFEEERRTRARNKAQLELEVKNLADGQSEANQRRGQIQHDLSTVQETINQREAELAQVLPDYNRARDEEASIKAHLDDAESSRRHLYDKQGRNAQFRSKKERDQWLGQKVDDINMTLAANKATAMQTTEETSELKSEISGLDKDASDLQARLDNHSVETQSADNGVQQAKDHYTQLDDHRKELLREEARLSQIVGNAKEQRDSAQRFLSTMMDANTRTGLATIREFKGQRGYEGLYGTLGELLEVNEKYKTPVEVTAGNSLFHYIVDNDETSSKLSEYLTKYARGRVTFVPLNRIRNKEVNLPQANDAVHLLKKMKYNEDLEAAFVAVFGKTIICPNLQIASQYARSHGVSAITYDGDQAEKKGKWNDEYDKNNSRLEDIRRQVQDLDQQITRALGELQKVKQKRDQISDSYGPLRQELQGKRAELQQKKDELERMQLRKESIDLEVRRQAQEQQAYETERSSPFQKALSDSEEQRLQTLSTTVQTLKRQYTELAGTRSQAEERKSGLEAELRVSLRPRMEQLKAQAMESGGGDSAPSGRLREAQRELQRTEKAFRSIEEKLRSNETATEQRNNRLAELEKAKAEKQRELEEIAKAIHSQERRLEKSLTRKAQLKEELAECSRSIRDLGVLPEEAFQKYENMSLERAMSRLPKVKSALKKYSHVNKKAFEQYNSFTKQRDLLIKRRKELADGQQSITDLIQVLDQRKDEAIERTFKQVSKEFATIFEKLVPAGKGRLIIQRKSDRAVRAQEEESEDEERRDGVENYQGVGISVSFNSKHDEQQRIQQLSGGQKSLCALALVFAIQACDPAPFYLFDEIDANLDAQYRTAVAQMLQESSESGQFICTTFRPEMVQVAEKCYGVSYSNKTSSIDVVSTDDALGFVEEQRQ